MTAAHDRKDTPVLQKPEGATIKIDRTEYLIPWQDDGKIFLTGLEIRKVADPPIDEKRDLFEVVPGGSDLKIDDDQEVEIRDGMRFFSAPRQINPGREHFGSASRPLSGVVRPHRTEETGLVA